LKIAEGILVEEILVVGATKPEWKDRGNIDWNRMEGVSLF
jgi:hypothetical protein